MAYTHMVKDLYYESWLSLCHTPSTCNFAWIYVKHVSALSMIDLHMLVPSDVHTSICTRTHMQFNWVWNNIFLYHSDKANPTLGWALKSESWQLEKKQVLKILSVK